MLYDVDTYRLYETSSFNDTDSTFGTSQSTQHYTRS